MQIDHTHDVNTQSWVSGAAGHPSFPLQNLPMGVLDADEGRIIIAIGDYALDVQTALQLGYLSGLDQKAKTALQAPTLNKWMALDAPSRLAIRHALFDLLIEGSQAKQHSEQLLHHQSDCTMLLPATIGDYSDFYSGIFHALKAGELFRPENPLLENYKHLPIAYHGRSSSINVSGHPIQRPVGQRLQGESPKLLPSQRMDFELELAMWAGPGNAQGSSIPLSEASEHIAGYGLFNDWSARDIQAWEYKPLGPFQGKSFASSVSPWVVTQDALQPFRLPAMQREADDPQLLDYLIDAENQKSGGLDIYLEVYISTEKMRAQNIDEHCIARSHTKHLYWTPAQMLAHHTLNGCNLRPGDLLASGTISTPDHSGDGSLLELTAGGKNAFTLPSGETRTFLEDGDEIVLRAYCQKDNLYRLGFGECRARLKAFV